MKHFFEEFKFCPKCGNRYSEKDFKNEGFVFICQKCSFKFFQNSKLAAAVIIPRLGKENEIIITKRAIDPGKGLYDFPGGFLNYGESSIDAAVREIKEELGLDLKIKELLTSDIVDYEFQGVLNNLNVLFYLAEPVENSFNEIDFNEIGSSDFCKVEELLIHPEKFIFPSDYRTLKIYAEKIKNI